MGTVYKGSHFNRDIGRKLKLPKSFPTGRIPYPSILRRITMSALFILPLLFPILSVIQNCISAIKAVRFFFVHDQMYDENLEIPDAENQFLSTLFYFLTAVLIKCIRHQSDKQYEPLLVAFKRKKAKSSL